MFNNFANKYESYFQISEFFSKILNLFYTNCFWFYCVYFFHYILTFIVVMCYIFFIIRIILLSWNSRLFFTCLLPLKADFTEQFPECNNTKKPLKEIMILSRIQDANNSFNNCIIIKMLQISVFFYFYCFVTIDILTP